MTKPAKDLPVNKHGKTLEERHAEHRQKLAKSKEAAHGAAGEQQNLSHFSSPWNNEIERWMNDEVHSMDKAMARMRQSMLPLIPMDEWDLDRWHHFGGPMLSHFPHFGSNMFADMEREMAQRRDQLLKDTNLNQLMPKPEHVGEIMDTWKNAYEIGDDGKLHFKVRFDCSGFAPESVKVGTMNHNLVVHAKEEAKSTDGSTTTQKEFCRTITLPKTVDSEHFKCEMTKDGVLVLEAPVNDPNYHAITFEDNNKLAIKPKEEKPLPVTNTDGLTMMDAEGAKKWHFEMPVESIYAAEDIKVKTAAEKIHMVGHKQVDGVKHEFTQHIETSEPIDPAHVRAQLNNHRLIVEAPIVKH